MKNINKLFTTFFLAIIISCNGEIESITINTPTIQCGMCQATIEKGLSKLNGVSRSKVDLKSKTIIKNGLRLILDIASQSGATHFFCAGAILDLNSIKSNKNLDKFLNKCIQKTLSSVHIMASASIGENQKFCPLNSKGQIDGLKNLLVIDQSTFPSCPTVNPQATAALISLINTRNFIDSL